MFSEGDAPGLQAADLEASIATLQSLAETIDAECVELRRRNEEEGQVVEYLIRKRTDERDFMEVRCGFNFGYYIQLIRKVTSCLRFQLLPHQTD